VVYLDRFLMSIRGIFRPIMLVGSGVDMPIGRGVLVPLASVTTSLVTASNTCKRMFIWSIVF
jgi:hypothetical protein